VQRVDEGQGARQAVDVPDTVWVVRGDTCDTMDGATPVNDGRRWFDGRGACQEATGATLVPAERLGLVARVTAFFGGLVDVLVFWT